MVLVLGNAVAEMLQAGWPNKPLRSGQRVALPMFIVNQ